MHQIVLLTAMSMTTGLFGGGKHSKAGNCGSYCPTPVVYSSCAPAPSCGTGHQRCGHRPVVTTCAPTCYPTPAPVCYPTCYPTYVPTCYPAPVSYNSHYYAPTSCSSGYCPR